MEYLVFVAINDTQERIVVTFSGIAYGIDTIGFEPVTLFFYL